MGANSQAMRPSLRTGAMLVFLVMCAPTAQAQCCDGCKHVHHQAGQGGRCWSGCADHCCVGCKHANHQAGAGGRCYDLATYEPAGCVRSSATSAATSSSSTGTGVRASAASGGVLGASPTIVVGVLTAL